MLPQPFSAYLLPILLLAGSNIFMATAWYWHLRFKEVPLFRVISGQTIVKRSLSEGAHDTGLRPDVVSGAQIVFEFTRRRRDADATSEHLPRNRHERRAVRKSICAAA